MDLLRLAGSVLMVGGIIGYAAGVFVTYPGRAFSITAVMVGITVVALARRTDSGDAV